MGPEGFTKKKKIRSPGGHSPKYFILAVAVAVTIFQGSADSNIQISSHHSREHSKNNIQTNYPQKI